MKRFVPGMRIIKTVLAVFICLMFFYSIGYYNPLYAVISCVLMMRHNSEETKTIGFYRVQGTLLGGFVTYLTLRIIQHFSIDLFTMAGPFIMSTSLFFALMICKIFDFDPYVYSMSGVVLLITLISYSQDTHNLFVHVSTRTLETLFGIFIAFIVNHYFNFGDSMTE